MQFIHNLSFSVRQADDQCRKRRVYKQKIQSQHIKVIHLILVPHNIPLDLAGVDPGDKVLHIASDEESRVGDNLCSDADVALFDEGGCLRFISLILLPYDRALHLE